MLVLNVSSQINVLIGDIVLIFINANYESQITETTSSVSYNNKCYIEKGFKIKIFNITSIDFRDKIWSKLQNLLKIQCCFVKYNNKYMGCIKDWPGVFDIKNCGN